MNENIDCGTFEWATFNCGTFECGTLVVVEPPTADPTVRAQPIASETVSN